MLISYKIYDINTFVENKCRVDFFNNFTIDDIKRICGEIC